MTFIYLLLLYESESKNYPKQALKIYKALQQQYHAVTPLNVELKQPTSPYARF